MLSCARRPRRRLVLAALATLGLVGLWLLSLPPEAHLRLAIDFNRSRFLNALRGATSDRDAWLRKPARYRLDMQSDIGYLIKTGYGTRHRIPEQLQSFAASGDLLRAGFLLVGDWTSVNGTDGRRIGAHVHDAIKMVMDTKVEEKQRQHPKLAKYKKLQAMIEAGDEDQARHLGQTYGWELDALKFITGLELVYKQLPGKKWYIILDDDSYLVRPSLELLLSHLDPGEAQYLGNAVGDYKGRFAHGGSAVILSGAAMKRLFSRPDVVAAAYHESLDETWGDRLVATTLQKVGVYLKERCRHYFNGEEPEMTRIGRDRICSPIVSFHSLRRPGQVLQVGRTLAKMKEPLLWGQLWDLFGRHPMEAYGREPFPAGDHVGPRDEKTRTWRNVQQEADCRARCDRSRGWCLAWTHMAETSECHASPWVVMGAEGGSESTSGINWARMEALLRRCPSSSLLA